MALPNFTPEQRKEMAERLDTNEQYIYQIISGIRIASPVLAKQINTHYPDCSLCDLRPNDWQKIWPELAWDGTDRRSTDKAI